MIGPLGESKALRAQVRSALFGRALASTFARFFPLAGLGLCLWLAPQVFPLLPSLPGWFCASLPLLAFWPRERELMRRVRILDRSIGLGGLLCAAIETPPEHPYARALAVRARGALVERPQALRAALLAPARFQRPRGLLIALLAFLLFLRLAGPLPVPGPTGMASSSLQVALTPPASGQGLDGPGRDPSALAGQEQGAPLDLAIQPEPEQEPESHEESDPAVEPEGQGPPGPPPPALVPGEQEKLALTPPPAMDGPKHLKLVYETEGLLPPPALARASTGAEAREAPPDPERFAADLDRAAERALGDGLLTPGEAWIARRQAEALRR